MNFFGFILLGIHLAFWICVYIFHRIWRVFSHYFSEYSFNSILFLLFFWNSNNVNIGSFDSLVGSWDSFLFQSIFSVFLLGKFYWFVLKFIGPILCHPYSTIEPIWWMLKKTSIIVFSSFIIFIWFFNNFHFLLLFLFFIYFKIICNFLFSHFYDSCFKIFFRHWFISVLVSVVCLFSYKLRFFLLFDMTHDS